LSGQATTNTYHKMNTATFNSRIEKASINKSSVGYKLAFTLCTTDTFVRPCYTSGSGRFTSNQDHTAAVRNALTAAGVGFEMTNDAARGSATGNVIRLTAAGRAITKGMRG
jgi:hypothetical protein